MPNVFLNHLKKEHQEVKSILEQLEKGDGKKGELFSKLKMELVPHQKAEEKIFYPVLLEKKAAREDTLEGFEEHHVAELVMKEMEKLPDSEEKWSAKMKVLKELINHHIKEEEGNIFKLAEKEIDKSMFPTILEKFEKESEKLKKGLQSK